MTARRADGVRVIATPADVDLIRDDLESLAADGWDQDGGPGGRFDWEAFLQRVELRLDVELPGDMLSPVILKVQRVARAAAREAAL